MRAKLQVQTCLIGCLLLALLSGLSGCSGSSNDFAAVEPAATRLIAGTVEDGPISGAMVALYDARLDPDDPRRQPIEACGASGTGRCARQFDNPDGHFSFLLALDVDPATLLIEATGGIDQATRIDFSRSGFAATPLRMLAPLDQYSERLQQLSINPLTTLFVLSRQVSPTAQGVGQQLLENLGLPSDTLLFDSPARTANSQCLAILLSKLALMTASDRPFQVIADYLAEGNQLIDRFGQLDQAALSLLLAVEQIDELESLYRRLVDLTEPQQMSRVFQQQEIIQGFSSVLNDPAASLLANQGLLEWSDVNLQDNLRSLADQILAAVGSQLLLGGRVPQHLARYVLYTYALEDIDRLTAPPELFAGYLRRQEQGLVIALEADPQLLQLARLQSRQDISVPLAPGELLLGDGLTLSDRKRAYYYNSTLSHLYQARQLVWNLGDDLVSDAVLTRVVAGEALAGRFAEAETLLLTQIHQSEARGRAWLEFARGLALHGFQADALVALAEAETLFQRVVDAKGVASFSKTDAQNFKDLAAGYVRAGYPRDALAVLAYLADQVAGFLSVTTSYGNLTTAGLSVVDAFAELGDLSHAEAALDLTLQLALGVPDDSNGTAKYRVRVLVDVAERSAELGLYPQVWQLWETIEQLRYAGGVLTATGLATELYMPELTVPIYAAGGIEEARQLIDSLPAGSGVFERHQAEAIKRLATYLAVHDGLGPRSASPPFEFADYTALDLIHYALTPDFFNPTLADNQIEALTFYNASLAYIAQQMIDRQRWDEAQAALVEAEAIVDSLEPNGVKLRSNAKINYGYAKLAELYLQCGLDQEAARLLEKGVAMLPLIEDPTYHAKAVAILAELYLDLADLSAAGELLASIGESLALDGYSRVIDALIRFGDFTTADSMIADYAAAAVVSYDPLTMDDSSVAANAVKHLVNAAGYRSRLGWFSAAREALQSALPAAWDIPTETTRMSSLISVAQGFAVAGDYQQAQDLAWSLPFVNKRNDALLAIADKLTSRDDFPDSPLATVDLDGDGRPDFFSADATENAIMLSGLELDRDSDQDGVADNEDRWPFHGLLPSRP